MLVEEDRAVGHGAQEACRGEKGPNAWEGGGVRGDDDEARELERASRSWFGSVGPAND